MGRRTDHRSITPGRRHLDTSSAQLVLSLIIFLFSLTACSFDYQQSEQAVQKSIEADMVLIESTYTILRLPLEESRVL